MGLIVNVSGHEYRIGRLDAFSQLHVARKIAPLVPQAFASLGVMAGITDPKSALEKVAANPSHYAASLAPLATTLAAMSDEHVNYVVSVCLAVVYRAQGERWAAVWNNSHNTAMFDDMGLDVVLRLVVEVIRDSLGNFISGLLSSSNENPPASNG